TRPLRSKRGCVMVLCPPLKLQNNLRIFARLPALSSPSARRRAVRPLVRAGFNREHHTSLDRTDTIGHPLRQHIDYHDLVDDATCVPVSRTDWYQRATISFTGQRG